jgi:NADPH:quinone reductase
MKAFIPRLKTARLVALADVPEPEAGKDETVVEVAAYSVNRGEISLLEQLVEGWRPAKASRES